MDSKNKSILATSMFLLFLIINAALFFAIDEFLLIYNFSDVIVFSWRMFAVLFFYPLIFYFCISMFYYLLFLKLPKHNNSILKFLTFFGILGFVISLPVYWYGDFKLKENGYVTCYKNSISAPQKYAKNEKLCD
ncbi:DUF1240 domain-containing protein [Xenorhabdus griffiniae]|uniref:DUF1240 domain-containing protein n=1 Tax=Xenorhabdus griffiniae TaxID=351672 RepID=A0ABY9XJQ1_9GAMM|nr:DUF1240 domain-containing protein [Xenorhabdus griffiniae]MBD1227594.1 DUF1240 domain-containing protein [Xenorhabdus griffiniae]MBE8588904.1 DUF1240 domain-containing protein [Xenorhabdus griffiniae]WMV73160.1 DUF1240 domain-containing protein [Xenorhabdus griffiniae]WNH02839.1 DUF1240 domain-containing protein [Xenorhabdus griffiniae]